MVHQRSERIALEPLIFGFRRGGYDAAAGFDILRIRLIQRHVGAGFFWGLYPVLDGHRFCDGFFFCSACNRDILTGNADTAKPCAAGELLCGGCAYLALFLPLFQHLFAAEHAVYGYVGDLPLT